MKTCKTPYGVFHKPTKTWVYFREMKDKFGIVGETIICLCQKLDATDSESPDHLKNLLLNGNFNNTPNYGRDNFLEFEIKEIVLSEDELFFNFELTEFTYEKS